MSGVSVGKLDSSDDEKAKDKDADNFDIKSQIEGSGGKRREASQGGSRDSKRLIYKTMPVSGNVSQKSKGSSEKNNENLRQNLMENLMNDGVVINRDES